MGKILDWGGLGERLSNTLSVHPWIFPGVPRDQLEVCKPSEGFLCFHVTLNKSVEPPCCPVDCSVKGWTSGRISPQYGSLDIGNELLRSHRSGDL